MDNISEFFQTRAVKSLLILDFKKAFEFNNTVWIFCIVIPVIATDILFIFNSMCNSLSFYIFTSIISLLGRFNLEVDKLLV